MARNIQSGGAAAKLAQTNDARSTALLESSLDCIILTDERGRIEEFNPAAERTFRIARAAALGKEISEAILPPALRPHLRSELFASVASNGLQLLSNRLDTKAVRADGSEFPAELTVTSTAIQNRTTFIVYVRDISARQRAEETLVRLAAIVECSSEAIIGTDLQKQITSWNKAAESMYGYTAKEAIGKDISIIIPTDRAAEGATIRDEAHRGKRVQNFETVRITKDGRRLDVSLTVSAVFDSDGIPVGASAIERDITAQKQAQEALRKANETSIYASPVAIIAVNNEHHVTMWNPAAEAMFGWAEHEVIGKVPPLILESGKGDASTPHRHVLADASETLIGIELQGQKRDGTFVAISLSTTVLRDKDRKIRGTINFLTDITATKQAEEVLRRMEQKYRDIFENSLHGIYQTTPQGKYVSANPALARILGFSSVEELIGSRIDIRNQEYVHPEMHEEFVSLMRRQGMVENFECEAYRKDKKIIWISHTAHVVRNATERIQYFEGTVQDVTEKRELEQQLRQMQKIEAVGRLAGGVAHDFNNVLMAISSYVELLQRRVPETDTGRKYLEEINKAVERAASLTQGLLTFSRKQVLLPKMLDLNALITQQINMLTRLVPENIEIRFLPGESLGSVKLDPSRVEQVVMNLVINARDAMADGGQVLIQTSNEEFFPGESASLTYQLAGKYVVISVADNGSGMDEVTKSQIFEPFFTTKEQGKGTGLGLAIVFGIVKQSGGQITVQTALGAGTIFNVYFPRVEERPEHEFTDESEPSRHAAGTILYVEDEDAVRESTAEYLTEIGYTVLKANGGAEALTIAARTKAIDLLLTDVIMPGMSGRELAEKVKTTHPGITIAFISGYSDNLLSNQQIADHGYVLLQKPIRLPVLAIRIREILNRKDSR